MPRTTEAFVRDSIISHPRLVPVRAGRRRAILPRVTDEGASDLPTVRDRPASGLGSAMSVAPSARSTQRTNVSWTNASESYVNIATAKPVMDATKAAASKPSGLPLVRATRPSRRTIRTISQIHPTEAEQAHVEEQAEPLVVEDRRVSQRIVLSGLSRAHALAEDRPAHAFDDPRHEVGAPADESRISCKRALRRDQALALRGKEEILHGRDRSRRDDLDDDHHREWPVAGEGGCHAAEATAARRPLSRSPGSASETQSPCTPMRIKDVGTHQPARSRLRKCESEWEGHREEHTERDRMISRPDRTNQPIPDTRSSTLRTAGTGRRFEHGRRR